jgi:predicted O-methyltransferase YrrM
MNRQLPCFRRLRPTDSAWHTELVRFAATLPRDGTMAEIGTFAGESAAVFSPRVKLLLCIDPWSESIQSFPPSSYMREAERAFNALRLPNVVKIKKTAVDAAKEMADGSLDVVYVDGDHRYESVRADVLAFLPKLKPDGWMCGHDYWLADVAMAVTEIFGRLPDELYGDGQPVGTWVYKTNGKEKT